VARDRLALLAVTVLTSFPQCAAFFSLQRPARGRAFEFRKIAGRSVLPLCWQPSELSSRRSLVPSSFCPLLVWRQKRLTVGEIRVTMPCSSLGFFFGQETAFFPSAALSFLEPSLSFFLFLPFSLLPPMPTFFSHGASPRPCAPLDHSPFQNAHLFTY